MEFALKAFLLALAASAPTLVSSQCLPPTTPAATTTTSTTTTTVKPPPQDRLTECPPNECYKDGCEVDPYLCKIECGTPQGTCTVTPGDGEDACPNGADITENSLDTECEELCVASRNGDPGAEPTNPPCRFWRYDKFSSTGPGDIKTCYLLSSEQCKFHKECNGNCDCGDVGCPNNGDVTDPAQKSCKHEGDPAIVYNPGPAWIHWTCYNDIPDYPDVLSPYNPDAVMYPGTVCFTTHKCIDWEEETDIPRQLSLICDGNTDGDTGQWVPFHTAGNPANYAEVLDENHILEHECRGLPPGGDETAKPKLVVTIKDMGTGAQLSCTTPDQDSDDTTYTIVAPNKCVLLCDFHLGLTIEGRLNEEGEFAFYIEGDQLVDPGDTSIIKCW